MIDTWTTIRRETGLIEHVRNGVGHPNFYSAVRLNNYSTDLRNNSWFMHGCNGDCKREDFPGARTPSHLVYAKIAAVFIAYKNSVLTKTDWAMPPLLAEYEGQEAVLDDVDLWMRYVHHDLYVNDLLDGKVDIYSALKALPEASGFEIYRHTIQNSGNAFPIEKIV